MPLLPVAFYGLEVPCGDILIPAVPDFPATFRITMAALDPTAPPELDENATGSAPVRATLKIVRQPFGDSDDDDFMRDILADSESESEDEDEDDDDEEVNGGPSDPSKSKKARKEAALKQLMESIDTADSDEEMEDGPKGVNGLTTDKKGKAKATRDDEEDDEEDSDDDDEEVEVEEFVICTLDPEKHYQQALDVTIAENERVFFKVTGAHTIYLTGNYVIPDDDGHNHHHEVYDSDSDEEEEEYDLSPDEDELELEMDDEESDDLDALEDPRITEIDSDEEVPQLIKAQEKKGKNKRSADELDESLDDIMAKSLKSDAGDSEPKLSKKQLKKLKKNNGEAAPAKAEEPKNGEIKTDKKVQFAKNLEQGPTGSAERAKAVEVVAPVKANGDKSKPALGVKTVGGVKVDDKKLGSGPAAKKGDRVGMRYIGKLAKDGQVFDSNKKGKPFLFKLGVNEVIKGWDIGVAGMQVGGERRLTIPAHLAYGSKAMPGIPGNSELVFDIKMLEIKK